MESNQPAARSWKQVSDGAWKCPPWSICSIRISGVESFELWHDKEPIPVFVGGRSFDEAKAEAKRIEGSLK